MLNVGIVGLGGWGRRLVESVQGSTAVRFAAAVVTDPARSRDFAATHRLSVGTDLKAMLADPEIGAVVSSGPAGLHAAHSLAAIEAGKPVLAVKPMALARADAERLREAAARKGVLLALGYNRCFLPAVAELRRRVAAGDLGTLLHAEGNFCVDRYFKLKADGGDWKTDAAQVLPGALADHPLYLSIELMGSIAEVHATASRRAIAASIMDTTAVLLRFRSGASGLLTAIGATANYERLTVFGSKGWAEVRDGRHFAFRPLEGKGTATDYAKIDTERAEMEAFAAAVAGAKPFPVPVEDAVHSAAVLEAMGRSAAAGRPVAIA